MTQMRRKRSVVGAHPGGVSIDFNSRPLITAVTQRMDGTQPDTDLQRRSQDIEKIGVPTGFEPGVATVKDGE
jgi:hypothetical protein